jgi:hypothetical protein
MSFNPPNKMVAFLIQKGLAAMDLYRAPQSGNWGPKSKAAYDKALSWWDTQSKPEPASGGFSSKTAAPAQVGSMSHRMVVIAHGELGTKESGGNNKGARIVEYQKATWLTPSPWPWCAAFICWVFQRALDGRRLPSGVERPRTVTLIKPASKTTVRAGDIVCYTFSHIGLAAKDEAGGYVQTIEGNTGPSGGRDGDGVWSKKRPKSKIRSIIRCNF